jgi:2-keto-4-pentenoate hydratase
MTAPARSQIVADRLFEARRTVKPIAPVRGDLAHIEAACVIQTNVARAVAGGVRRVALEIDGLAILMVEAV